MIEKRCFKCDTVKPLFDFYKHPATKDGHVNKCIECNKQDVKANREKRAQYYKAYDMVRGALPHRKDLARKGAKSPHRKKSHAEQNKAYKEKFPERQAARESVSRALRSGTLTKLPCIVCGNSDSEGHHPDYDRPLDVVWLCPKHHKECHHIDAPDYEEILSSIPKGNRWDFLSNTEETD